MKNNNLKKDEKKNIVKEESHDFILDIKRLGINGEGIGFYNKKAIFVKEITLYR